MLSVAPKNLNAYILDTLIESRFLPEALSNPNFLSVDAILTTICSFNAVLTSGPDTENDTPGQFRTGPVVLTNSEHTPPQAMDVRSHMVKFAEDVIRRWDGDRVELHAFVLWRLNWIHPFFDGNGRTSRQFSYFLLCVKFGGLLPGKTTITSQIQSNKMAHYSALREADRGNFDPVRNQSLQYLREQLKSALGEDEPSREIDTSARLTTPRS